MRALGENGLPDLSRLTLGAQTVGSDEDDEDGNPYLDDDVPPEPTTRSTRSCTVGWTTGLGTGATALLLGAGKR